MSMKNINTKHLSELFGRLPSLNSGLLLTLFWTSLALPAAALANDRYVGSEACANCHREIYRDWQNSGHHLQLRSAEKADHSNIALPPGYQWKDISYVVGGINRKANFVDQNGYLITMAKGGGKAKTQYNLESESWSDFYPGEVKKYDCALCHTTGYKQEGHQNGRKGIVGTWAEDGIGCENCHGPSSRHAEKPRHAPSKLATVASCEGCHQRGGIGQRPLEESGLVRHHEQINELKLGAHKGLSCLNCHNPHKKGSQAKYNCTICHSQLYHEFKTSIHGLAEIKCFECHMPRISQKAISRVSYIGEVRSHLFKINVDPDAEMFKTIEEDGRQSTFTKGFITVDYVCLTCHGSRDKAWAVENAKGFHKGS